MNDLFGSQAPTQAITISSTPGASTLSKAQKAFNTLIKKIDARRSELAAWEAAIPAYQKDYVKRLAPLKEEFKDLQIHMVRQLDNALLQTGLSKADQDTLHDLLLDTIIPLLGAAPSEELKAIYNRHTQTAGGTGYEADLDHDAALLREELADEFGIDLGDDFDLKTASPEDLLRRIAEQAQRAQEEDEARRAKRKKTKKQLEKEARVEAEEKDVSQALREVFRKLASALHPDREPDPDERARKTSLMQRANQAYDSRNLLQLLELQLELEHIDAAALASLSEDRLKHFNKVLKEQLAELDMEIMQTEARFAYQFSVTTMVQLVPAVLPRLLEIETIRLRQAVDSLVQDLKVFADRRRLKAWIKDVRREMASIARHGPNLYGGDGDCPF